MNIDEMVPVQFPVSKSLRQRLKIAAAHNHTTMRDLTVALIERGLREEEKYRHKRSAEHARRVDNDDMVDFTDRPLSPS